MKPLTAKKNIETRFDHSGTSELSRKVPVASIKLSPNFEALLPINEDVLSAIKESMTNGGYDNSQPIHIWKEENILIDGHTRLRAAKELGLYDIPVFEHSFKSEADALEYALLLQFNRRNLSDSEIITVIKKMDEEKRLTAEQLAKFLGISQRKVERARSLIKNADEETLQEVIDNKKSISSSLPKPIKKELKSEQLENEFDEIDSDTDFNSDISDSLSDNSGNPASLNFNHSDGIERPDYKISKEEDLERTQERKNAYELGQKEGYEKGYSDGAYDIFDKIFELLDSGLSVAEVKNHEIFDDFSYSEITKKLKELEEK